MQYTMAAMVRTMKIQEVILKAISKQIMWIEAADIIGVSYRTMKRWKARYLEYGYDGLFDRRKRRPSPKRVPLRQVEKILSLYREKYMDFNVIHFHEKLTEEHGIELSYTFVKSALQGAGLIHRARSKGKHRRKRPRKPLMGMMLHLDGSPHQWIPHLPGQMYDLLVLMDDATSEIYEMALVDEEDTLGCMKLIKQCIASRGLFCSLYTDRATHFFYTPKAGEKVEEGHFTQIHQALRELNIKAIPSYSPQARGRSERMNKTLQGRLPNEFRLHGIRSKEEANLFLKKVYIRQHNKRFKVKSEQSGSAFIPIPEHLNLDRIFSVKQERTVAMDNTVSFQRLKLQVEPSHLKVSFAKCKVIVHLHVNHTLSITYGPHTLGYYDALGKPLMKTKRRVA